MDTWKIAILVIVGVLILGGASYGAYYYWQNYGGKAENNNQDIELKLGESMNYKGLFNLNIKLVEINKISGLFENGKLTTKGLQYSDFAEIIGRRECPNSDCGLYKKINYYVLQVKHADGNALGCGAQERSIAISQLDSQSYECPSFYDFMVDSLNSNDVKVKFQIKYLEVGFQ
ncbi:MAG: hypothetical protein AAB866_00230 [Patescibacteria group bacterium]